MASGHVTPVPYSENVVALRPDNRLRELRQRAGLTVEQLAAMAGMSPRLVHRLENEPGGAGLTGHRMRRLADALSCRKIDFILHEEAPDRLSDRERAFIDRYRAAGEAQKAA